MPYVFTLKIEASWALNVDFPACLPSHDTDFIQTFQN